MATNNLFIRTNESVQMYKSNLAKMKLSLRELFIEDLKVDLAELKLIFPNLDKIFILGYTPEWNDGEECNHESEIFIHNDNSWSGVKDYLDRIYHYGDVPDFAESVNKNLTHEEVLTIEHILSSKQIESNLEIVFETNFHIIFDLTGDNINIEIKDYDCGH